jgi:hypothetical protein
MRKDLGWASFAWACLVVVVPILGSGTLYALLVPGLSSARTKAPKAEVAIATWLLHQSVPSEIKSIVNPLGTDPADITAGRDLLSPEMRDLPRLRRQRKDYNWRWAIPSSTGAFLRSNSGDARWGDFLSHSQWHP